ncbi:MAG: hypothetical protein KAW61_01120 [candidate division Zixibacteria bacterium]|nr:hypothetical protein [candidate division Zixibacteria bacterium]
MTNFKRLVRLIATALLIPALLLIACSSEKTAEKPDANENQPPAVTAPDSGTTGSASRDTNTIDVQYKMSDISFDLNGAPVSIAGVTFNPASQWQDLGMSGEKQAFYKYGPLPGDSVGAEMAVYYFGEDAGAWEDRMERWINQMSYPNGRDPHGAAIRHDRQVDGMTAHVLSMLGTYNPPAEGFDREDAPSRSDHRLVGVVVEAPKGYLYFKLTGPEYTSRIMIEAFMNMIYIVKQDR